MRFIALVSLVFSSCVSRISAIFSSPQQAANKALTAASLTDEHLKAAKLCREVYSNRVESLSTFVESKDTGAQATVTLDGSRAIVCFRGSDSLTDWRSNFRVCRVPFLSRKHDKRENEVHSGFFIGHNSVKAKIYAKLNAIIESGKCDSVLFSGHSAGATLAAISAFDFRNDRGLPLEVITFGSPKIGNAAFAGDFNSAIRCTRIVNDNDCVALAPLFRGYRHVGRDVIHLREPEPGESLCAWDGFIADHDIESYVATIERSLKKQT